MHARTQVPKPASMTIFSLSSHDMMVEHAVLKRIAIAPIINILQCISCSKYSHNIAFFNYKSIVEMRRRKNNVIMSKVMNLFLPLNTSKAMGAI